MRKAAALGDALFAHAIVHGESALEMACRRRPLPSNRSKAREGNGILRCGHYTDIVIREVPMRAISMSVLLLALGACSTNAADAADASSDEGLSELDSAVPLDDSAFGSGDVSVQAYLVGADTACTPACPAGDFCFAIRLTGGGPKYPRSGGDAGRVGDAAVDGGVPQGCYPLPAA